MSSSISKVGDVVIITQVLPRGESAIPVQSPATNSQQAPPPPTKMGDVTSTFLQGRPLNLGVVQILLGVLCVLFSLTSALSQLLVINAPFCLAIVFVASGSVAVATGSRTSMKQVWASLISHMVSVVVSAVGVAYASWLLSDLQLSVLICDDIINHERKLTCVNKLWLLDSVVTSLLSLVLVLLVLQFCVAATVSVFSGKSIRCHRRHRRHCDLSVDDHNDDHDNEHDTGVKETSELCPNSP